MIGDLHGCFGTLEHALAELAFDSGRDRLFSVGDPIDRGPRSAETLAWLESGRITATVRGNHEQMMVNALEANEVLWVRKSGPGSDWLHNGGDWWYDSEAVARARKRTGKRRTFAPAKRWARRNVICLDTGLHYDEWGHLTVAEIQGPDLKLHRFARSEDDLNRM